MLENDWGKTKALEGYFEGSDDVQCYSVFSADLVGAVAAGLPAIGRDSVRRPYFLIPPLPDKSRLVLPV